MLTSLFLAVKLEENLSPLVRNLILYLTKEEEHFINEDSILQTEKILINQLDFDFQMVTSHQFLERFIQLTQYQPLE
eukprot:CAMPEP_0170545858 /NCGR_PEP_ID=MMETSP0211-20121228/4220_1 /TAXON_ID=311385 /ORGANISM="Pseudokeronopsis sp., Strain OXSARD2" /LENGTH=76 /DNA_ID=CAMNT_0010849999 /DNA_START=715 /DNA_END=945 /DNA_ORIENTATION=-